MVKLTFACISKSNEVSDLKLSCTPINVMIAVCLVVLQYRAFYLKQKQSYTISTNYI